MIVYIRVRMDNELTFPVRQRFLCVSVVEISTSWALLGGVELYWPGFILSIVVGVVFFLSGLVYFRKEERSFADVI